MTTPALALPNTPYFIALNALQIRPLTLRWLLQRFPLLSDCFALSCAQLIQAGLPLKLATAISAFHWPSIQDDLAFEETPAHHLLTWEDPRYPALLHEIADPPPVLYGIGHLACLARPTLAIVGSRRPSPSGRHNAYQWAKALGATPLTIVSGLALGIDGAAHQGCLATNGATVAVLGAGLHHLYPSAHRALAKTIAQTGLLLSEFPLTAPARAGHFPQRNRIISGLSLATLVIEAALKSGSLITARFALEQNREVLALPGSIHLPQAQGCHSLLKQGATLVTCYQDVLDAIGLSNGVTSPRQADLSVQPPDPVLDCIGFESTSIDIILMRSALPIAQLTSRLAQLELDGRIAATMGGYIRRY